MQFSDQKLLFLPDSRGNDATNTYFDATLSDPAKFIIVVLLLISRRRYLGEGGDHSTMQGCFDIADPTFNIYTAIAHSSSFYFFIFNFTVSLDGS